ncbi:MAG: ATP-binding protein, partial [Bacteroidota bacterium]
IREKFEKEIRSLKCPLFFIEMKASEKNIKERTSRKREHSHADFEVYKKIKADYDQVKEKHLVLQSDQQNLESMIDASLKYLKKEKSLVE